MISPSLFSLVVTVILSSSIAYGSSNSSRSKSFTTPDGFKYVYDYIPAKGNNETVLLMHGFPSTRRDWQHQVNGLTAAGFGVILPDQLGFGDSDRPLEVEAYGRKKIAGHIAALLDNEGLNSVVGAGHDWGSLVLAGLAVWYPERFSKLVYLSVPYSPPGLPWELDAPNKQSLQDFGFMKFGYWYFFNSWDAGMIAQEHLESMFSLSFPANNSALAWNFADLGAARASLSNNTILPLAPYMTVENRDEWLIIFGRVDAMETAMNFYKALMRGVEFEEEQELTDADRTMHVPVLMISGEMDALSPPDEVFMATKRWAAGEYITRTVKAGHWVTYEAAEAVTTIILDFLAV